MAFRVLNMLSFWTTFVSVAVMIAAFVVAGGARIGGWTSYPPLSALGEIAGPGQGAGETLWIVGLAIFCGASLMGALNFITTLIDLRAKGMTLGRLPLTCWTWFVTAILGLLAFGVLLAACILLLLDRIAGTSFFVPGGLAITDQVITWHKAGSPLLFQHLFSLFVSGGISGLFLAQPSLALYLHDAYFVVAHFHLIMGVAAIFGMSAGTYFWFPKMFGRFLGEGIGKVHFWFTFVGVYAIFMPMHFLGLAGNPRRYADMTAGAFLQKLQPVSVFISLPAV